MNDTAALVVDAAILITLGELAVLFALWHRSRGAGRLPPREFVANVAAGLFLMLGLRAALGGASWAWIAASLAVAGTFHGVDLLRRLGR